MDRNERVSALIDNEVSEFEVKQILNEMLKDDSQRQVWQRYHMIRDAIQGNLPVSMKASFASDVMSRVYADDAETDGVEAGISKPSSKWRRSAYGSALAASLALMAVMVYQYIPVPTETAVAPVAFATPPSPTSPVQSVALEDTQSAFAKSDYAAAQQIHSTNNTALSSYLVNHAEYAGSQAMIPYARIVGYDMDR